MSDKDEKAAELKKWIIDLGGDPEIENVDVLIEERIKKHGK
jgi:hypothetical protein